MSNLRDQLLKAGLVSAKQAKQAAHQERVHRKEVGHEAIEAERRMREEAHRRDAEEKKQHDRAVEEARRAEQVEAAKRDAVKLRIQGGWIKDATAGDRRFFFVAQGERITFLDLNERAMKRLQQGGAAIVETCGVVRGEHCVIEATAAEALESDHREIIRFWNRGSSR